MISVIMPVFNGERTIRRALQSIVQEHSKIETEIIVVDDGSTDQTPDILHELQQRMPLRVIHQKNSGPGAARNVALGQTHGDFVTFLDADDYFAPMALERMRKCILDHHANACVAGTRQLVGAIPISSGVECWHQLDGNMINALDGNFLVEITPGIRAKMFRRKVLTDLAFSRSKWEDLAFIPAALVVAGQIAILDEPMYNYQIHLNTTVKDFLFRCKAEDIFVALEKLERNLQNVMIHDSRMQKIYRSILTLHTVFRMQNVMTWLNVNRNAKQQTITALANQLTAKYPEWREDAILCDPETGYQNPFFRMMLDRLYKNYLN